MELHNFCDIRDLLSAVQNLEELTRKRFSLSLNEAYTLCLLTKHQPLSPGFLVKELKVTPSRVSRIIEHLEAKGYITRALGQKDSRTREINLTSQGEEFSCSLTVFEKEQFPIFIERSNKWQNT